jgi:hypothetical protein
MAVTQGRNDGRKTRTPAKTMTSDSQERVTNTRRVKESPTLFITNRNAPRDILDTGLEDAAWHYLWVNKDDTVTLSGYYNDGYRFVRFEDVKDAFKEDEMRKFLYTEDENGWVRYGDQNRLMKIPQQVYRARLDAALNNGGEFTAAEKAKQLLEATINQGKYEGTVHSSARVSEDADSGTTETTTLNEGGTK